MPIINNESSQKNIFKEENIFGQANADGFDHVPIVYSTDSNGKYLVKQFIEGVPMEIMIENNLHISLLDFLSFSIKIFNYFHNGMGYIIEDFKPNNIIQATNNKWYFIDMGSAKLTYDSSNISVSEQPILGSKMYLHCPPELLLKNYSQCCIKIDYFALGVLCYRIIVGEYPFSNSESNPKKIYKLYSNEYKHAIQKLKLHLREYNDSIIDFIIDCLNPDVEERASKMINIHSIIGNI